jgi:hypothetical protein
VRLIGPTGLGQNILVGGRCGPGAGHNSPMATAVVRRQAAGRQCSGHGAARGDCPTPDGAGTGAARRPGPGRLLGFALRLDPVRGGLLRLAPGGRRPLVRLSPPSEDNLGLGCADRSHHKSPDVRTSARHGRSLRPRVISPRPEVSRPHKDDLPNAPRRTRMRCRGTSACPSSACSRRPSRSFAAPPWL